MKSERKHRFPADSQTLDFAVDLLRFNARFSLLNKQFQKKMGISMIQIAVLNILAENPNISALGLAEKIGIHPSSLTQSLKRLQRRGYLVISKSSADTRKKIISISPPGFGLLIELKSRIVNRDGKIQKLKRNTIAAHEFLEDAFNLL